MASKSKAQSPYTKAFDGLIIASIMCYGFLLIVLALATAIANPGKAVIAILAMLGIATYVGGNPVHDAFKVAMAKFREARAVKAA